MLVSFEPEHVNGAGRK